MKAAGLISARSPASMDEMAEAYRGMWRGLGTSIGDAMLPDPIATQQMQPSIAQLIAENAKAQGIDPSVAILEWLRRGQ